MTILYPNLCYNDICNIIEGMQCSDEISSSSLLTVNTGKSNTDETSYKLTTNCKHR